MAQTTTAVNACDVVVSLDDGADALTDISGSSNQVDLEFSINIGEWRSFGGDYPVRRTCGKDAAFTLVFVYSETDDEARDLVLEWYFVYHGASRSLQIDVPDGTVGSERFAGEVILESFSTSFVAGEGSPITLTANMLPDGEWTYDTIAS